MRVRPCMAAELTAFLMVCSIAHAQQWTCTHVIGYSQVKQWYHGGDEAGGTSAFEQMVGDDNWQLQACSGAGVQRWADPSFSCWDSQVESPCVNGSAAPERFVLSITDYYLPHDDVDEWVVAIQGMIAALRIHHPQVQQIVLQSVVGGPGDGPCWFGGTGPPAPEVRAARNHPTIDQAISQVAGGDVVVGMSPEVRTCDDYSDVLGHLVVESEAPIGTIIGEWYQAFDAEALASVPRMVQLGGAADRLGVLLESENGSKHVYVKDAVSGAPISAGVAFGPYYQTRGMVAVPDFAGTPAPEIAVAGVNINTGRVAVRFLDSRSGERINELTFSSTYPPEDIVAVRDFGDGHAWEIALLGTHETTGRILVRIKDSSSGEKLSDLFFPPTHHTIDMVTVPNFDATAAEEIALLGIRPDTGAVTVRMRDAASGDRLDNVPFSELFSPKSLVVLRDLDGGGRPEIGVLGIHRTTSQVRVRLKDAFTGVRSSDLMFSERYVPGTVFTVGDFAGTDADEISVLGVDVSENVMVRLKDAESGDTLQDLPFSRNYEPLSVVTLPSIGGRDARVALLGRHRENGSYLIRVKNVSTGATVATIPVP